jgi:hypothetical protein
MKEIVSNELIFTPIISLQCNASPSSFVSILLQKLHSTTHLKLGTRHFPLVSYYFTDTTAHSGFCCIGMLPTGGGGHKIFFT